MKEPKLVQEETALYRSRRADLEQTLAGLRQALQPCATRTGDDRAAGG